METERRENFVDSLAPKGDNLKQGKQKESTEVFPCDGKYGGG
jgi:hypothetical protein